MREPRTRATYRAGDWRELEGRLNYSVRFAQVVTRESQTVI